MQKKITIGGLLDGHSGIDIGKGYKNAAIILAEFLYELGSHVNIRIADITSGGRLNVIPSTAEAVICMDESQAPIFDSVLAGFNTWLKATCSQTEPNALITAADVTIPGEFLDRTCTDTVISTLLLVPNGVSSISTDIPFLVQTSSNLGSVAIEDKDLKLGLMIRSNTDYGKEETVRRLRCLFENILGKMGLMLFCTVKLWDLEATSDAYNALKNPILYAMLFIMLLRCDLKKIMLLIGAGLMVSASSQAVGTLINGALPFFDKATWTVLVVTALGLCFSLTPFGKLRGTEDFSNVILYIVVALIASRADLSVMGNAPAWLLSGFIILVIRVVIMIILCKLLRIDIFTASVASLANIGGTATAPVLAGTYSSALVPVGIIMALLGYVIGTGGGLIVAHLMSLFA